MTDQPDPARTRFMALQMVRLSGLLFVLLGAAMLKGKVGPLAGLPPAAGYAVIAVGLADFFAVPPLLARRWRG